jgi:hypothetical protein
MVALKEQQQPRDAPVAVAKRMNTKKVEIETSQRYQRMDPASLRQRCQSATNAAIYREVSLASTV